MAELSLNRRLTLLQVVLYGLGVTIGAGIYALVGSTISLAGVHAPVAFVVADSAEAARDAADLIEVDYEPIPTVVDGKEALAAGAPAIWDQAPGTLAFHLQKGDHEAVAQAMKAAAAGGFQNAGQQVLG